MQSFTGTERVTPTIEHADCCLCAGLYYNVPPNREYGTDPGPFFPIQQARIHRPVQSSIHHHSHTFTHIIIAIRLHNMWWSQRIFELPSRLRLDQTTKELVRSGLSDDSSCQAVSFQTPGGHAPSSFRVRVTSYPMLCQFYRDHHTVNVDACQ